MNRDALLQTLRVHIMRLRQQQQRQHGVVVGCTVDELVCQVEGTLSTEKPDYGFGDALAQLQRLMNGTSSAATTMTPPSPPTNLTLPTLHRRSSIGASGSLSEIIDAEAMVSRHSLKTLA